MQTVLYPVVSPRGSCRGPCTASVRALYRLGEETSRSPARLPPAGRTSAANAGTPGAPVPRGAEGTPRRHQRIVPRSIKPCSGASSLAGSLRVPSRLNVTSGATSQRAPVRHDRPPPSASESPA